MQPTRYVGIPVDHVAAEMAAFPLASERALELSLVALDPMLEDSTGELWAQAERDMLGQFPGFSVDEAVSMRDKVWFGTSRQTVRLHEYLRRIANEVLERRGSEAVPKLIDHSVVGELPTAPRLPERRRWWRWLAFALPPDLLLAAVGDGTQGLDTINLLSPGLERQLADQGFAETHLHLGAALDFPQLWVGAMHAIADSHVKATDFQSPGADLQGGAGLGPWLLRAALARYVLTAFLAWGRSAYSEGGFAAFVREGLPSPLARTSVMAAYQTLVTMLLELRSGRLVDPPISFSICQTLYADLVGLKRNGWGRSIDQIQELDPIHDLLPPANQGRPTPEVSFIRNGLEYLETLSKAKRSDAAFEQLFWQVIRIRCLFYRHAVQRPMTPGLQWFIRFYGRLKPARNPFSERLQVQAAARICGHGHGLKALEVRTSPWGDQVSLAKFIEGVEAEHLQLIHKSKSSVGRSTWDCCPSLEFGVIFHFTKDRGGGSSSGQPKAFWQQSYADPRFVIGKKGGNPSGYRYASFYSKKKPEALALAWVLSSYPLALQVVRGLDVCTDELGVPSWVFAPLLNHVRAAASEGAAVARSRLNLSLPPLRTTIHAGEDFVHLLTGLRLVDEAVEQLGLREGDRIGHGVSLGVNPHAWARRAGRLPMSAEDRMWDLVWEWSWYSRSGNEPIKGRRHTIEYDLAKLTEKLFKKSVAPIELETLATDLTNVHMLRRVGFPNGLVDQKSFDHESRLKPRLELLHCWLTNADVFEAGHDIVWVEPARERLVLAHLQAELRRKLGQLGIVVEINPTSNLLIGDLEDLTRHPMWRLRPPRPLKQSIPPVGVCIGSDDPLTFNSNLRQEYQCLADAMTLAGLSEEESRVWLDQTRTSGLESRFTFPRVTSATMRELINIPQLNAGMLL